METSIKIPEFHTVKSVLRKWVLCYPRITKIYLYGSYITKSKNPPDDIDIAIEIDSLDNDTALGYWCSEGSKMEQQLEALIKYNVDLEWFDAQETPTVRRGLEAGCITIYERQNVRWPNS